MRTIKRALHLLAVSALALGILMCVTPTMLADNEPVVTAAAFHDVNVATSANQTCADDGVVNLSNVPEVSFTHSTNVELTLMHNGNVTVVLASSNSVDKQAPVNHMSGVTNIDVDGTNESLGGALNTSSALTIESFNSMSSAEVAYVDADPHNAGTLNMKVAVATRLPNFSLAGAQ